MNANKISLINKLLNMGVFEIESLTMDAKKDVTYHTILHKYRDVIIIPAVALTNTYDFFMFPSAKKIAKLADGTLCEVEGYEERHVCELEADIEKMYDCDAWSFIKRWYKYDCLMTSMMFIKIYLKISDEKGVDKPI